MLRRGNDSVDCVIEHTNVVENLKKFKKFLRLCKPHGQTIVFCSGGPSLKEHLDEIHYYSSLKDHKIACVQHALPVLLSAGIEPDFCVILDPRSMYMPTTHGISHRANLFEVIPSKTVFLVGAVTNFELVNYLYSKTNKIIAWLPNSFFTEGFMPQIQEMTQHPQYPISFGHSSFSRGLQIFYTLGFRTYCLFGTDCSLNYVPTQEQIQAAPKDRPFTQAAIGNDMFWTTAELVVQASDLERFLNTYKECQVTMKANGLGMALFKTIKNYKIPLRELLDFSK